LHYVVISPQYKDGAITGTPSGRNECHAIKDKDSNRKEMRTNQERMEAKMDASAEKMELANFVKLRRSCEAASCEAAQELANINWSLS
jgi:hypothetical protein